MTDYLKEELERARALLEEVKRLERSVPGRREGEAVRAGAAPEAGGAALTAGTAPEADRTVLTAGAAPEADRTAPAAGTAPETDRTVPTAEAAENGKGFSPAEAGEETERRTLPLMEELERLERASSSRNAPPLRTEVPGRAGAEGAGARGGYPWALPGPGRGGPLPGVAGAGSADGSWNGVPDRSSALAADEMRWAEWADRAFQRDSRRYDGGFYLY